MKITLVIVKDSSQIILRHTIDSLLKKLRENLQRELQCELQFNIEYIEISSTTNLDEIRELAFRMALLGTGDTLLGTGDKKIVVFLPALSTLSLLPALSASVVMNRVRANIVIHITDFDKYKTASMGIYFILEASIGFDLVGINEDGDLFLVN